MYERILVPVDGSPTSSAGLDEAIKIAKLTRGRLRLLHVVDQIPFALGGDSYGMGAQVAETLRQAGRTNLELAHKRVTDAGISVDEQLFDDFEMPLSTRVLEQVQSWKADLVVLGTHGRRGLRRMMLGSDAESIVRTSTAPVLLVRGTAAPNP